MGAVASTLKYLFSSKQIASSDATSSKVTVEKPREKELSKATGQASKSEDSYSSLIATKEMFGEVEGEEKDDEADSFYPIHNGIGKMPVSSSLHYSF